MAQTKEGALKVAAARVGVSVEEYRQHQDAGEKWCYACHRWRDANVFNIDRSRWDGRTARCHDCQGVRTSPGPNLRERRQFRARSLAWCRGCKDWKPAAEIRQGACRQHRAAEARARYAGNPAYRHERLQHARSHKRAVLPVPFSGAEILLDDFNGQCAYCGAPAKTWDHIIPVKGGGETLPWNIVPACTPCNSSKRERDLFEWAQATGRTISQRVLDRIDLEWVSHR